MSDTQTKILLAIVSYLAGLVSGVVVSYVLRCKKKDVASNDIVLLAVTMVWTLTRLTSLINTNINISPALDALMGGLVGYFYKGSIPFIKKKEDENKNVPQS